jgi:hypothetical protein
MAGGTNSVACSAFAKDGTIDVLVGCPGSESKARYRGLLEQLSGAETRTFVTAMNSLMTVSSDKPLVAETTSFESCDLDKINAIQQWAADCLKSPTAVFGTTGSLRSR